MSDRPATLRLDKWLWHARFFKTRSLATKQCTGGHIRVNGETVNKASRAVKPGDELEILRGHMRFVVRIIDLGERRGPAQEAQALYEELVPAENLKPKHEAFDGHRPAGAGRPTKKDRRMIDALKAYTGFQED